MTAARKILVAFLLGSVIGSLQFYAALKERFYVLGSTDEAMAMFIMLATFCMVMAYAPFGRKRKAEEPLPERPGQTLAQIVPSFLGSPSQFRKDVTIGEFAGYDPIKIRPMIRPLFDVSRHEPMQYELADAMESAFRLFALTGSSELLAEIGRGVAKNDDVDAIRRMLASIASRQELSYPFLTKRLDSRSALAGLMARQTDYWEMLVRSRADDAETANVQRRHAPTTGHLDGIYRVMRAYEEAIAHNGRPVPTTSILWLKKFDRRYFYALLNIERQHLGRFHPEGIRHYLTYLKKCGRPEHQTILDAALDAVCGQIVDPRAPAR
jgi:hypothetical protein